MIIRNCSINYSEDVKNIIRKVLKEQSQWDKFEDAK